MAYSRRSRASASRARRTRRSSRSTYSPRRSYGRRRTSTRGRSAAPRTIRIVVETVAAAAAQPASLLGMKQAAAPKQAKF